MKDNQKLYLKSLTTVFLIFFVSFVSLTLAQGPQVETVIQTGHSAEILSIDVSPDGKFVVTASTDHTAILWDVATGKEVREFVGHRDFVNDVEFDPTGKFIVTGSADRTAKLWEAATGKEIRSFRKGHRTEITCISISPNGKYLATGCNDDYNKLVEAVQPWPGEDVSDRVKSIIIWDLHKGMLKNILNVTEIKEKDKKKKTKKEDKEIINKTVADISFTHNSKHLVASLTDHSIKVFDVKSGKLVKTYVAAPGRSFGLSSNDIFSKNVFKYIKSSIEEKMHYLLSSRKVLATDISPDSRYVVSGHSDGSVRLWQLKKKESILKSVVTLPVRLIIRIPMRALSKVPVLKLLPKLLPNSGNEVFNKEVRDFKGHTGLIYSAGFSPDGKYIVTGCTTPEKQQNNTTKIDNTARIWEVATGKRVQILKGHTQGVTSARFSSDGKYVVTSALDNTAKLWDANTGQEMRTFAPRSHRIKSAVFSPNKQYVAVGGTYTSSGSVRLWDLNTGRQVSQLSSHFGSINTVRFSPAGDQLVTTSEDNTLKLWNLKTEQGVSSFKMHEDSTHFKIPLWLKKFNTIKSTTIEDTTKKDIDQTPVYGVKAIDICSDGSTLAAGMVDSMVGMWDIKTGKELKTFGKFYGFINSLKFSPDGKTIMIGSYGSPELWEFATGKQQKQKYGRSGFFPNVHEGNINSISFSPDGQRLLSGSEDHTAILWEVKTGKKLADFKGHADAVESVCFSPDNQTIVTASRDNMVKIWNANKKEKQILRTLTGHSNTVHSVEFSQDGKYLVTASSDGSAKLWNPVTGEELASFIAIDSVDYAVITPDYYYMGSKNAHSGIAFRIGNKIFPFEQFDLKFNRPDIVLERIGGSDPQLISAYKQAYQKRLQRMNFTEEMLGNDVHLPEVKIIRDSWNTKTTEKSINFQVHAADSSYLLDRLNVFVNDVPIYGIQGIDLRPMKVDNFAQELHLELCQGENKIQVSVLNEKGVESLKETFTITYHGQITKPDLYLMMIGVSEYADSVYNLKYAAKDAEDLERLLCVQSERFNKIHSFKLLNQDATKENIFALKDTLIRSHVDDELILFVAGHGLLDDRLDYYFATTDIDFEKPSERGLLYEEIEGLLDGIPARKKLLLMDTCHSGEVDKEETILVVAADTTTNAVKSRSFRNIKPVSRTGKLGLSNSFQLMQELFANLSRGSGAVAISAASGVEFAYEDQKWQNGVFTHSLLEGLKTKGADLNKDGELRVSELRDYVTEKVKILTNGRQTPTSRRENLEFDFRVF